MRENSFKSYTKNNYFMIEKENFKKCKLELVPHVVKRLVERNFPISRIRNLIFKSKWGPHILDDRRTCICQENSTYWTIIIAISECHIFIITVYESKYSEKMEYKRWGKKYD